MSIQSNAYIDSVTKNNMSVLVPFLINYILYLVSVASVMVVRSYCMSIYGQAKNSLRHCLPLPDGAVSLLCITSIHCKVTL